jgi:hypothetical protein
LQGSESKLATESGSVVLELIEILAVFFKVWNEIIYLQYFDMYVSAKSKLLWLWCQLAIKAEAVIRPASDFQNTIKLPEFWQAIKVDFHLNNFTSHDLENPDSRNKRSGAIGDLSKNLSTLLQKKMKLAKNDVSGNPDFCAPVLGLVMKRIQMREGWNDKLSKILYDEFTKLFKTYCKYQIGWEEVKRKKWFEQGSVQDYGLMKMIMIIVNFGLHKACSRKVKANYVYLHNSWYKKTKHNYIPYFTTSHMYFVNDICYLFISGLKFNLK